MKRDMDLIRLLMLRLESFDLEMGASCRLDADDKCFEFDEFEPKTVSQHLVLIEQSGLIMLRPGTTAGAGGFMGLTWTGHDFVDSVRDPEIWKRTKKALNYAGGYAFELIMQVAKAVARDKIKKFTGIDI